MKTIAMQWTDLIGKTVTGTFETDDRRALVFDDCVAFIKSERGWDGEVMEPELDEMDIYYSHQAALFVTHGVITADEESAWNATQLAKRLAAQADTDRLERREFERLSLKFGPPTGG